MAATSLQVALDEKTKRALGDMGEVYRKAFPVLRIPLYLHVLCHRVQ